MKLPRYPVVSSREKMIFEFVSEGKNGYILKMVEYELTHLKGLYNLAFGDKNLLTGGLDDKVTSNNGDREKVLRTVASTIYEFTNKYPDARIYATGSTKARTRLYRMGISKFLEEISEDFIILGELGYGVEVFKPNMDYIGFLIMRKSKSINL